MNSIGARIQNLERESLEATAYSENLAALLERLSKKRSPINNKDRDEIASAIQSKPRQQYAKLKAEYAFSLRQQIQSAVNRGVADFIADYTARSLAEDGGKYS
jgi:hypothetical protein